MASFFMSLPNFCLMRAATEHVDENVGRGDCLQTNFDANILYERDRFRGGCSPKVYHACETYLECAALCVHPTQLKTSTALWILRISSRSFSSDTRIYEVPNLANYLTSRSINLV